MDCTKLTFLLILGCFTVSRADNDHGSNAVSYDADNFASEIAKKAHFVMFFAPWCGHCKRLAPTWDDLASEYNANLESAEVIIAKVDCTLQTKLCSDNGVSGYPTLKFFTPGSEGVKHRGGREKEHLKTFIAEQLAAQEPATAEEKNMKQLTGASFPGAIAEGHAFIKFYAPWCPHCQRMETAWENLADEFAADKGVTVGRVDCTEHKDVCSQQSVSGYPTLMYFKNGEMVEKYQGSRVVEDMKAYVTKMRGEADPDRGSEEEKVNRKEPVVELTAETFEEATKTGVYFVKFYAPWCGHCKNLAPTWEDLGVKFADKENINIAKVDCTKDREVCSERGVRGFPTLLLYKNGENVGEYNGRRELESLYNFVTEKIPHDEL